MPFERCYECRLTWPEEELEGGLCGPCRGLGPDPRREGISIPPVGGQAGRTIHGDFGPEPDAGPLFGGRS